MKKKDRKPFKNKTKQPDPTLEEIEESKRQIRAEWDRRMQLSRWVGGYGRSLQESELNNV